MRRHRIEGSHATRSKCATNLFDFIGFAIERAADHQKHTARTQTINLTDDRLGGQSSENHLVHGAENDTPSVHDDGPPADDFVSIGA
jgi:hypothetical protein